MKIYDEIGHEELLERAMCDVLTDVDLRDAAEKIGVAPLADESDVPLVVNDVVSLDAAGFMTGNCGVCLRLSDGSEFTVKITRYRGPRH